MHTAGSEELQHSAGCGGACLAGPEDERSTCDTVSGRANGPPGALEPGVLPQAGDGCEPAAVSSPVREARSRRSPGTWRLTRKHLLFTDLLSFIFKVRLRGMFKVHTL